VIATPSLSHREIAACMARGASALLGGQLVTGEIATHRDTEIGKVYTPSPFMSALAHDALACLDPRSPHHSEPGVLTGNDRHTVAWSLGAVRRRIRRFLIAQEEADGTWCFYGRGSALGPDAATTACAALAVARRSGRPDDPDRWQRHARALARFRTPAGPHFTFVAGDAGYSSIAADGRKIGGFDRIVNAHVMRFLAAAGDDDDGLAAYLEAEVTEGDRGRGSLHHPDPACFAHAVARAWTETPARDARAIAGSLLPWLLARQDDQGGFGGPLSTALAALALVDLGYAGDALDRASHYLLATASRTGEWPHEPYLSGGHGSAAFTTAFALAALARATAVRGGVA